MAWPPSLYANCEQRPLGARGADIPAPRADPRTPGPAPSAALARFPAPRTRCSSLSGPGDAGTAPGYSPGGRRRRHVGLWRSPRS